MLNVDNLKIINGSDINPSYLTQNMPGWSLKGHDAGLDETTLEDLKQEQETYQAIEAGVLRADASFLQHSDEISVESGKALPFITTDGRKLFLHPIIVYKTEAGYNCLDRYIIKFFLAGSHNLKILVYEKEIKI